MCTSTSTLKDPEWHNTQVIDGDVVIAITRLKESPGTDIVQYGSETDRIISEVK